MKTYYKAIILFILAVLTIVVAVFWTPNMVLCTPALVFLVLRIIKRNKASTRKADLLLLSLTFSEFVIVLQILVLLGRNIHTHIYNITTLAISIVNSALLTFLWAHDIPQNNRK